jgi:DNA-binding CsgD family transcriptional regulator
MGMNDLTPEEQEMLARLAKGLESDKIDKYNLTPTEQKVLALLVQGLGNEEIMGLLFVSKRTVEDHISKVYRKLHTRDRNRLIYLASADTTNSAEQTRPTVADFKRIRRLRGDERRQRSLVEAARAHYEACGYQWTTADHHFLSCDDWCVDQPILLTEESVTYDVVRDGSIDSLYESSSRYWPDAPDGSRIDRYSDAITAYDHPKESSLWANNLSYRLTQLDRTVNRGFHLMVARMNYFDGHDCWAALEYESLARLAAGESIAGPYRQAMGDPFQLAKRNVAVGLSVLTVRRDPELGNTFYLHLRGKEDATLPNMYGALPAGEFQPASKGPGAFERDLSLWKCILREYAEEMLGYPVYVPHGNAPNYGEEILRLNSELGEGVQPYILDFGLDPVTLKAGFRIACIIDAEVFDVVFPDMVSETPEGEVLSPDQDDPPRGKPRRGFPLTENEVTTMLDEDQLTTAVRLLIRETWNHREVLGLTTG